MKPELRSVAEAAGFAISCWRLAKAHASKSSQPSERNARVTSTMGIAVNDGADLEAIDRLAQEGRAAKREDLPWLAPAASGTGAWCSSPLLKSDCVIS